MGFISKAFLCGLAVALALPLHGQSLAPRAYVITPEHWNAVIVTWSFYDGGFNVNGALPITGATGTYNVPQTADEPTHFRVGLLLRGFL